MNDITPGWGELSNSKVMHYFLEDRVSACGAWMTYADTFTEKPMGPACRTCILKVNQRAAKKRRTA